MIRFVEVMSNSKESRDLIFQIVESSIEELVAHFLKNPYFFYTENDIHCHLFNIIFQKFELNGLNKPRETLDGESSILLHKEYPTKAKYRINKESKELQKDDKGRRGHFDLCVWNPDLVNEKWFRHAGGLGEQETIVAIEIALVENNYHAQTALNHTKRDLLKLSDPENNVKHGYMLFFARNWENREDFKKLAKKQLDLGTKPTSIYIERSNDLKINLPLIEFLSKP